MTTKFADTYVRLKLTPCVANSKLRDHGVSVHETLCAFLYLLATESLKWKWTDEKTTRLALRRMAKELRRLADECDRIRGTEME